jgi:hypothetical protein
MKELDELFLKVKDDYIKTLDFDSYYFLDSKYERNNGIKYVDFILNLYGNSKINLTLENLDKFVDITHYDKFIDISDESNKNILLNMLNKKILDESQYVELEDIQKIGFNEITVRNLILRGSDSNKILDYIFNNKYPLSEKEYLYIYENISTKDYFDLHLEPLLKLFTDFNVYMNEETFIKFCHNQKFYRGFDFKLLKNYTLFKNEDDKIFNDIVEEIKKSIDKTNELLNHSHIVTQDIQKYIDELNSSGKKIELDDIIKFCIPPVRYLFDQYKYQQTPQNQQNQQNQQNETNPPKNVKIVKKIVKKVVKKIS